MFPALQRFFEAVECRTQAELAEFLGIKQSSISDAKKRKTIPPDWLLTALRKKGIRPDGILTGQGARMLQSCDGMGMVVFGVHQKLSKKQTALAPLLVNRKRPELISWQ